MYRVIAIVSGGLALAACSSFNLDALKPAPPMDTVRFESEPPGADAKVSNGQTCRTPCALALQADANYTVTFTLNGFQPATEAIEAQSVDNAQRLDPNPVLVQLTPAAPPKKPVRKRKPAAKKPAAPKQPAAAAPPAPAAPPPQNQPPSPWPPAQPQPVR